MAQGTLRQRAERKQMSHGQLSSEENRDGAEKEERVKDAVANTLGESGLVATPRLAPEAVKGDTPGNEDEPSELGTRERK